MSSTSVVLMIIGAIDAVSVATTKKSAATETFATLSRKQYSKALTWMAAELWKMSLAPHDAKRI